MVNLPSRAAVLGLLVTVLSLTAGGLVAPGAAPAAEAQQRVEYAIIEGSGSTWSDLVLQQWIGDVSTTGLDVVYQPNGSTRGRSDFADRTNDFAVSEIPYQGTDEDGSPETSNGRAYAYVPIVAGATAFTYQLLVGGKLVRNLRLSGETIARIFTNEITSWSDPAITADNNGRRFPRLPITPIVRSDGSGTTAQLTAWLDARYPAVWRPFLGRSGATSYFPRQGRAIGQAGSDQVMAAVRSEAGNGTIGYVEAAYPATSGYPVVSVRNQAGYYTAPTSESVAVALTRARIDDQAADPSRYLVADLSQVYAHPDPRAYPLSSYSYAIIPTGADDPRMNTAKRQSLVDFFSYSLCQGQTKPARLGYSPLPLILVQAGYQQLARLKQADPAVELSRRDVRTCGNPTYDGRNANRNLVAETAPLPLVCDRQGAGPCPFPRPDVNARVTLSSPVVRGVHLVRPDRVYLLTVRTNSTAGPRYFRPVPRAARFQGAGLPLRAAGVVRGATVWKLRVEVRPGATVKKIGVRVGTRTVPLLVRRAR